MNDPTVQATKRCSKCGEEKAASREFFYRHPETRDRLAGRCRSCFAEDAAERNRQKGAVTRRPLEERFAANVVPGAPGECWEWRGWRDPNGYGRLGKGPRSLLAHRIAKAIAIGVTLDDLALDVCHRCDNPPCVNPDHLFLGTHTDNMRDMRRKGRHRNGQTGPLRR